MLHPPLAHDVRYVQARVRPDAVNGFLKRLAPVRLALGAPSPRSPARSCSFEFMSREERSSPARALPRSPCRCRLGGNRRGRLIGARRERGETRLGATRLAPEVAQTCEGCEAMPEQSVGDNRATQLIGAQRRVNARVRALAALDRKTLAAGTAGRLSGKGRAARYPTRKNPGSPWNWPPRGLGCQHPGEGTIAPRIFLHPPVTCVIRRERLDELLPQTDGT